MSQLSKKDLGRFKTRLEKRREVLKENIRAALANVERESYLELAGGVHTASDESFAVLLTDMNISVVRKEDAELQDTEAALQRIGDGSYGVCIDCGGDIVLGRLEIYPTAKRCMTCQARHENVHGGKDATPSL
jgi:RNA polymerase-binding transcription factor DksA